MPPIRKANAYSKRKVTPFTRTSKKRTKSFIKVVPPQKIVKFAMGSFSALRRDKLPHKLTLISTEKVQIRHNALESCRQFINRNLEKNSNGQFLFKVIPYPHHIQRENKMLTGAGADRMQTGMALSFGKSVGKAAILKEDSAIFEVYSANDKIVQEVRKMFKQVKSKLPGKTRVLYEKIGKTSSVPTA